MFLRFFRIGHESLWFDEGWTWWLTGLSPGQMFDVIRNDVVGPLSFYLLKGWRAAAGGDVSEVGLRMPSAIYATLTLVPFYVLVRAALRSTLAQLVACGLMAVSFMQLQYTREARPYALLCLMTVSALACVPTLAERRSWRAMVGFALFASGGLYTHNMMLFSGTGLAAAWLLWPGERRLKDRVIDMAIAGAIVAVLYLPWLPILKQQTASITGTFWAARPDWSAARVAIAAVCGVDVYGVPSLGWMLFNKSITAEVAGTATAIALLATLAAALAGHDRRRLVLAIACVVCLPMLVVFLLSQVSQPLFMERAFISSSALVPILFALPLEAKAASRKVRIATRSIGGVACLWLGVFAIASSVSLFLFQQKEDWRGAYEALAKLPSSPTRLVVLVANEGQLPFDFYATRDASRPIETRTGAPAGFFSVYPPRTIRQVKEDRDLDGLRQQLVSRQEVFLVLSHDNFSDPEHRTEQLLDAWGTREEEHQFRGVRVVRYRVR